MVGGGVAGGVAGVGCEVVVVVVAGGGGEVDDELGTSAGPV